MGEDVKFYLSNSEVTSHAGIYFISILGLIPNSLWRVASVQNY
jgi:hypothetical protein